MKIFKDSYRIVGDGFKLRAEYRPWYSFRWQLLRVESTKSYRLSLEPGVTHMVANDYNDAFNSCLSSISTHKEMNSYKKVKPQIIYKE